MTDPKKQNGLFIFAAGVPSISRIIAFYLSRLINRDLSQNKENASQENNAASTTILPSKSKALIQKSQ